jgi:hypothetical protein
LEPTFIGNIKTVFTKDTFVIRIYSVTGRRYVMKKVDELTKNRREMDRENISGHMPEDREMPEYQCAFPYRSFLEPTFIGNIKTVFRKLPKPVALRVKFLFCLWRATISTILNNATAQYFPVATHAANTKQFKFNITCSNESQYTINILHNKTTGL